MSHLQLFGRLFLLGFITFAVYGLAQSTPVRPGTIQWYANKAKQQGETSITVPGPVGIPEQITSLDQALSTYHAFLGTPISAQTQLIDPYHVVTWYKIKIDETLIAHPNPEVPAQTLPTSLLPVASGEIVTYVPGGTVTMDGVKVTVTDQDTHLLTLNTKYLFLLAPDSSGKFASVRSGGNSVFTIRPDNNKIEPLVANDGPMQVDFGASTAGSLDELRKIAKSKKLSALPQ